MPISLPQGFIVGSVEPIDSRLTLSKSDMLLINDNKMPENYFCICNDDNKLYVYKKGIDFDPVTGRFRLYSSGVSKEYVDQQISTRQKLLKDTTTAQSGDDVNIKTVSKYSLLVDPTHPELTDLDLAMRDRELQDILV